MAMDPKKKGEIALAIFRAVVREKGIRLFPREIKGKIAEVVEKTGLPEKDVTVFVKEELEIIAKETIDSL